MDERAVPFEIQDVSLLGPSDHPGDIVLVDKASNLNVLTLCIQNHVKHVIQRSNLNSTTEIGFSGQMLSSPADFFQFPLSCILGEQQPNAQTEQALSRLSIPIESYSERGQAMALFEALVKKLTPSPALLNDILTTLDEAMTNAIFNAPYAHQKAHPPSRDDLNIPIDPARRPVLFAGHDNERIIVGCRDSYGSLDVQELVVRIKHCYENNLSDVINFGEGGAGIGSFLMFDYCASMYIGVDSGRSATICCSFPLRLSAAKRSELPKNIHLIHR